MSAMLPEETRPPFRWTPHRFSGGALALDVANSVILRFDPARRTDRYAEPDRIDAFAEAASRLSADAPSPGTLVPPPKAGHGAFLRLREATDAHFRAVAQGSTNPLTLADLLDAIAAILRSAGGRTRRLDVATAHSALALLATPKPIRICPNCGWLFVDFSKNRSRTWCDMAVCGNRAKAGRFYRRRIGEATA